MACAFFFWGGWCSAFVCLILMKSGEEVCFFFSFSAAVYAFILTTYSKYHSNFMAKLLTEESELHF